MNQDDFNYKALEQLKIIASRLESIERMLGDQEEDFPVVDRKEAMDKFDELLSRPDPILEPLWITGTNPQTDKMVIVHINFGPVRHVGHISNDGIWTVYDLDGDIEPCETIKHYFGIVLSWRELTEEENTMCWERGIL